MAFIKVTCPRGTINVLDEMGTSRLLKENSVLPEKMRSKLERIEADTYKEAVALAMPKKKAPAVKPTVTTPAKPAGKGKNR